MALNLTGRISLGGLVVGESINLEFGDTATSPIGMNSAKLRAFAGRNAGEISLSHFRGKSSQFTFNLTSATNVNLRIAALNAGWDGSSALVATIPANNVIQSASSGSFALTIDGNYPSGVSLVNNGLIVGKGGNGGTGGSSSTSAVAGNGGGTALFVNTAITIDNLSGIIKGGGGGGGGGGGARFFGGQTGGGGGGGGASLGAGGAGGSPNNKAGSASTGSAGSAGGASSAVYYGAPNMVGNPRPGGCTSGVGGFGGGYASTGASGGTARTDGGTTITVPGAGGGAGGATSGNSFITWSAVGTRNGALN
jgi:hypothetical protein